jgi:hypothetical protein
VVTHEGFLGDAIMIASSDELGGSIGIKLHSRGRVANDATCEFITFTATALGLRITIPHPAFQDLDSAHLADVTIRHCSLISAKDEGFIAAVFVIIVLLLDIYVFLGFATPAVVAAAVTTDVVTHIRLPATKRILPLELECFELSGFDNLGFGQHINVPPTVSILPGAVWLDPFFGGATRVHGTDSIILRHNSGDGVLGSLSRFGHSGVISK